MPGKSHKMGNFTVSRPKRTRLSRITKICGVSLFGISGINWENQHCFYFFNEFPNLPFCDSWWPSFPAKKILNLYYRRYHYQCCIEKWICYITCCEVFWKLFLDGSILSFKFSFCFIVLFLSTYCFPVLIFCFYLYLNLCLAREFGYCHIRNVNRLALSDVSFFYRWSCLWC